MSTSPLHHDTLAGVLKGKSPSFGTFLGLGAPMAAEVAAVAGAQWVVLDLEHGGSTRADVGHTVLAAGGYGVPTIVRVPTPERIEIGQVLDAGAAGVMVPRIASVAGAQEAVAHMSHPPHGDRGVASYNRAARWGFMENPFPAPRTASCLIQIETRGALDDCEAIASLDGVDALFVGPLDLSFALGTPRDFSSTPFVAALGRVVAGAQAAGVPAGILAPDGTAAARFVDQGFSFVAIGSDSTLFAHAVAHNITAAKAAATQKKEDNDVR